MSKVLSLTDKWEIHGKLQSPPRNSAQRRLHRRCFSTGRQRANYRDFGLSGSGRAAPRAPSPNREQSHVSATITHNRKKIGAAEFPLLHA
ncbi:unnamed protein product [Linum tenue]|uniref:Uncharacterized protein n=1 Tax=Linum tenue TaxID=586396 RepID=A0AAV0L873_9ROSI|nr:unnamed protein product [Linum tenue]